jgi:predicted house-cleaning noncanonical NTP pyrophosphatase (MazG superfamily)
MRMFYQNKLWRDKLIAQRQALGAVVHQIQLSDEEYSNALAMKLVEESEEIFETDSLDEIKDELADILEAIDCLLAHHKVSFDEILKIKADKKKESGSYTNKILIEYAEYPAGSKEEQHCLENIDRYPEILDADEEDFDDEDDHEEDSCCK